MCLSMCLLVCVYSGYKVLVDFNYLKLTNQHLFQSVIEKI